MIAGRASLIQDKWEDEKGSMLAVEADSTDLEAFLIKSKKEHGSEGAISVACYNGPRSFTLAGTVKAIEAAESLAKSEFSNLKLKKLNVTNAFHSTLVEPLIEDLERLGEGITLNKPDIQIERATESPESLDTRFLANHLRKPVFFNNAVQRLASEYPTAIWLEAGSNSGITSMANRALGSPSSSHFQAVNITSDNSFDFLTDSTIKLWKEGMKFSFWAHHPIQATEYTPIILPPYQFEKSRHWMELKKPRKELPVVEQVQVTETPRGLTTFLGYEDEANRSARFKVNTSTEKFHRLVSAHIMASTAAVCPAVLQLDIAIDALMSLRPEFQDMSFQPQSHGMNNYSPLMLDDSKVVLFEADSGDTDGLVWDWKILTPAENGNSPTFYSSGVIVFQRTADPELNAEFERLERMVSSF